MLTDDERPARKIAHEIGQDLGALSIGELRERIDLMRAEIGRLEAAIAAKSDTRSAAEALFKS